MPDRLASLLQGHCIRTLDRRGKYLLFGTSTGTLIAHLGMSGSLRLVTEDVLVGAHDHLDIRFDSGRVLRYTDQGVLARSCGLNRTLYSIACCIRLRPEPLEAEFDGDYLHRLSRAWLTNKVLHYG